MAGHGQRPGGALSGYSERLHLAEAALSVATAFLVIWLVVQIPLDITFLGSAFLGGVVLHIWRIRRKAEALAVAALAVALGALRGQVSGFEQLHAAGFSAVETFLGLASFLVLGLTFCWSREEDRNGRFSLLLTSMAIPGFVMATSPAILLIGKLHARTYDPVLYSLDAARNFAPSFRIGQMLEANPFVKDLCVLAYYHLPLAIALLYGSLDRKRDKSKRNVLAAFGAAGVAGFVLYNLVPAVGPRAFFLRSFPNRIPPAHLVATTAVMSPTLARDAMPSLHMGWAVLLFWNARRSN